MAGFAASPLEVATEAYRGIEATTEAARARLGQPLTLAEKVLVRHLASGPGALVRGETYVELSPDRVALQDATAQMALLQFMVAGLDEVAVPTTVHCDHLIQARLGSGPDLEAAVMTNREVYDFLRSCSARYGIGFWRPGAGIIHQVVLEQYAFPGGLLVGTDSHTPNAGGLGMVAVGVGGADAVDVMTGSTLGLRWPRLIGVRLTGRLSGWAAPKDVILKVADILTVSGATGAVVEYLGPGAATISATGRATICNMGAEIGATTSLFGFDGRAATYLRATGRAEVADAAEAVADQLRADPEVEADPGAHFDELVELDLSTLEPHVVGPHTPDRARPASALAEEARREGWPLTLSAALVGSCTNSSYEDLSRAASVARQAAARGLRVRTPLLVTPGSEQVRATVERDGVLADLEAIGASVLANACGPCIGQWERSDVAEGEPNAIITSFNRNFPKRNDGNPDTLAFIASPETTVAYALAGTLDFDPAGRTIDGLALTEPSGDELPARGFCPDPEGLLPPPEDRRSVAVRIDPASDRLQRLEPFPPWDGTDLVGLAVLLKAAGKCTTDHISPAGRWLRYRGHLANICGNLFTGASNALTGEVGTATCPVHDAVEPLPDAARHCREHGRAWVVVGDENYGEGSSREHAAMEPRYLGARAVVARSFARIHETNLKKQGVLALTFADPATYDAIGPGDRLSFLGLAHLAPGEAVAAEILHADGTTTGFSCHHTLSEEHIAWLHAGSALNLIASRLASRLAEGATAAAPSLPAEGG